MLADRPATRSGEHEILGGVRPVGEPGTQLLGERRRQRHGAALVVLRRAPRQLPIDLGQRLGDPGRASHQVEALHLEAEDLPGAQARVGADQHQQPIPRVDRVGQVLDLDLGQEVHLVLGAAGESSYAGGDVDGQPVRVDRRG